MERQSIETFIERFDNGDFVSNDVNTQCDAGWYDWFCKDSALAKKTIALTKKLISILGSDKIDTKKMYVFFKNNCPMVGPTYDDFRICDIETGDVIFTVATNRKIPTEKIRRYNGTRWQRYETICDVWGRENCFEEPLAQGSWKEIKKYFLR